MEGNRRSLNLPQVRSAHVGAEVERGHLKRGERAEERKVDPWLPRGGNERNMNSVKEVFEESLARKVNGLAYSPVTEGCNETTPGSLLVFPLLAPV